MSDHLESGCSTSVVLGLSRQIADEVYCLAPDALVPFPEGEGIVFTGSAVLPYLSPQARDQLLAAVAGGGGLELRVTSAFRTVAQQYLLYEWYRRGRCGITAAAQPGRSNHESGRALDIQNYSAWASRLPDHGWAQTVLPHDPVHFDHLASPDLRGYDVLAFQRLWNRNHPEDPIAEDGDYGPETAARLAASPADGFSDGACSAYDAELVAADAPRALAPGERAQAVVELVNTGGVAWEPGATFVGTTGPNDRDSALHDPASWIAPHRPATVEAPTAPGEVGRFRFAILAPEAAEELLLSETFGLVEEAVTWFGPGDIRIEVLVGGDGASPEPDLQGGCRAGGAGESGAGLGLAVALVALGLARRRPRRRWAPC